MLTSAVRLFPLWKGWLQHRPNVRVAALDQTVRISGTRRRRPAAARSRTRATQRRADLACLQGHLCPRSHDTHGPWMWRTSSIVKKHGIATIRTRQSSAGGGGASRAISASLLHCTETRLGARGLHASFSGPPRAPVKLAPLPGVVRHVLDVVASRGRRRPCHRRAPLKPRGTRASTCCPERAACWARSDPARAGWACMRVLRAGTGPTLVLGPVRAQRSFGIAPNIQLLAQFVVKCARHEA